ncbi:MAG: hypothetical protein ACK4GQ_05895, partial [Candidatus Hadarchaeales archaeon]
WHPVVEVEAISPYGIIEAKNYWNALLPLSQRGPELAEAKGAVGEMQMEELEGLGFLSREEFSAALERLAKELERAAGEEGEISYWDFITRPKFSETLERAWLTSFLITYGYADAELRPLEDEIILRVGGGKGREEVYSMPISVTREEWRRRVGEKSRRG